MEIVASFVICLGASLLGAVCGIGGGIIIKPLLDAIGMFEFSTINFMSCCTVLSMSFFSVVISKREEEWIDKKKTFLLAMGAALGGIAGKIMLKHAVHWTESEEVVGYLQAFFLLIMTLGTLCYMLFKAGIKTRKVINPITCIGIGLALGMLSSFLGIGGGPINLVILSYFFSMDTKEATKNSLYIILYSQLAGILQMLFTHSFPVFDVRILLLMMLGGVGGGYLGRRWNQRLKVEVVNRLFVFLMVVIILINIYNVYIFSKV